MSKSNALAILETLAQSSEIGRKPPRSKVDRYLRLTYITVFTPGEDDFLELATRICLTDKDAEDAWKELELEPGQVAVWVSSWRQRMRLKMGELKCEGEK